MKNKSVNIIAYYLPQFHEIPENDRWWGKGFTEWTNVKAAKSLFDGHRQPRVPYGSEYYSLDDVEVLYKQAKLAKSHGVSGFCFYHYWFMGKQLLEKPCEKLLEHPEIEIDYCFSWANEPWARTWDGKSKDVLQPQDYGGKHDWKVHFDYLEAFFKDPRYIKIDGAPMIVIYKSSHIPNFDEMCDYWNELAMNAGFKKGLHIVETMNGKQNYPCSVKTKAVVEFEPSLTLGMRDNFLSWAINKFKMLYRSGLYRMNYTEVVNRSVKRKIKYNKDVYLGCFPGWDNTPRKKNRGVVFTGESPAAFRRYLEKQVSKLENQKGYIFINAWNEWAEGAYLEPDTHNEYAYLNAIKHVMQNIQDDF